MLIHALSPGIFWENSACYGSCQGPKVFQYAVHLLSNEGAKLVSFSMFVKSHIQLSYL